MSATLAFDVPTGSRLKPVCAVFATTSLEVAIFCAAVYSRDGWSGWNTYEDPTGDHDALHEFFAAPRVLRKAMIAMHEGREGSVYRVKRDSFQPYEPLPGQFISTEESVPVVDEYPVSIIDMGQTIVRAAQLLRTNEARPGFMKRELPEISLKPPPHYPDSDPPIFADLSPDRVAIELRTFREAGHGRFYGASPA